MQLLSRGAHSEGGTLPPPRGAPSLKGDATSAPVSPESEWEGRSVPPEALDRVHKRGPIPRSRNLQARWCTCPREPQIRGGRLYPSASNPHVCGDTSSQPSGDPV